jgi:hypothetical protein
MGLKRVIISHPHNFVDRLFPNFAGVVAYITEQLAARDQEPASAFRSREQPIEFLANTNGPLTLRNAMTSFGTPTWTTIAPGVRVPVHAVSYCSDDHDQRPQHGASDDRLINFAFRCRVRLLRSMSG